MPSFTGKTFSNFYKNLLGINQTTNTGVDTTTREVQDGAGNNTAISLSDDNLTVKPQNNNTTTTFTVSNAAGNRVFGVGTTDNNVYGGLSLVNLHTHYAYFATDFSESSAFAADIHHAITFGTSTAASSSFQMGTANTSSFGDTDPASTLTITGSGFEAAQYTTNRYWYVMDNITIDAVSWWHGADSATGDVTVAHLMGYDVVSDNSSTSGDLSSGVVLADGDTITNAGEEQIYYQSMTVQSADVDAGKVIMFTFAFDDQEGTDYSINATVKYHIR